MNNERAVNVYMMRHAKATGNQMDILMGQGEYSLTDEGILQAQRARGLIENVDFAVAYSSDLTRAQQTVRILLEGRDVAVVISPLLKEQNYGDLEGQRMDDLRVIYRDKVGEFMQLPEKEKMDYKFEPHMESAREVCDRFYNVLNEIVSSHPGESVLVITHSSLMRAFLFDIDYLDTFGGPAPKNIPNVACFLVITDGEEFKVQLLNG